MEWDMHRSGLRVPARRRFVRGNWPPSSSGTAGATALYDHRPTGALGQTFDRDGVTSSSAGVLTAGVLQMVLCTLPAGPLTSISFRSAAVGATTPTNQWFGVFDLSRNALGLTNDDLATAWAAQAVKTLTIAGGPVTIPTAGDYYLGVMVAAATAPTLVACTSIAGGVSTTAPIPCGNSTAALTAPPGLPFQGAALTATVSPLWGWAS
jgi:hypothetical protein